MPRTAGPVRAVDVVGLLLVTAAAFALVWALTWSGRAGWGSVEVIGSLAAAALLGGGFVGWERRVAAPMVPLALFRVRAFAAGNLAQLCLQSSLFGALFFMAQFLQLVHSLGALGAGLRLLPWSGSLFVVGPVAGALTERVGERAVAVSGLVLQSAGMLWVAVEAWRAAPYGAMVVPLLVAGVGTSTAIPATAGSALGALPLAEVGPGSGVFSAVRQLGGVLGVAIAAAVFAGVGGYGSREDVAHGIGAALVGSAALAAAAALCALGMPARRIPGLGTSPGSGTWVRRRPSGARIVSP